MDKKTQPFWQYDIQYKWKQVEKPKTQSLTDIGDFLASQDYLLTPDFTLGDELNFISVYDHAFKEEYLFHLIIDDIVKIIFANSLPAMLELLKVLTDLLNSYFETCINIETLKDDEDVRIE